MEYSKEDIDRVENFAKTFLKEVEDPETLEFYKNFMLGMMSIKFSYTPLIDVSKLIGGGRKRKY